MHGKSLYNKSKGCWAVCNAVVLLAAICFKGWCRKGQWEGSAEGASVLLGARKSSAYILVSLVDSELPNFGSVCVLGQIFTRIFQFLWLQLGQLNRNCSLTISSGRLRSCVSCFKTFLSKGKFCLNCFQGNIHP